MKVIAERGADVFKLIGKVKVFSAVLLAGALITQIPAAEALIIQLSDGVTSVSVTDGGVGDACPFAGCINFTYSSSGLGSFVLDLVSGLSQPLIGDLNTSVLDLNSLHFTTNLFAASTFTITMTDTDFTQAFNNGNAIASIGGTTTGLVDYYAYLDANNTPFGTTTLLGDLGSYGSGPFSGGSATGISISGPYSLTQVVTISHSTGQNVSSFDAELKLVPQPAALILLGSAMLLVVLMSRRWPKPKA